MLDIRYMTILKMILWVYNTFTPLHKSNLEMVAMAAVQNVMMDLETFIQVILMA